MAELMVKCDRCGREMNVLIYSDETDCYNVRRWPFTRYANEGERMVCRTCILKDERYIANCGKVASEQCSK